MKAQSARHTTGIGDHVPARQFDATDLSEAAEGWDHRLLEARVRYDDESGQFYDEVFSQTSAWLQEAGEAGKADIAVIAFWKRPAQGSWLGKLLAMPDRDVRHTTRSAFTADGDAAKLVILADPPGLPTPGGDTDCPLVRVRPHTLRRHGSPSFGGLEHHRPRGR